MDNLYNFFKRELERREKTKSKLLKFKARDYQKKILKEFENGQKYFLICWARRLGKDIMAFYLACSKCINNKNSVVFYIFPTMKQGKMMILDGYTNDKKSIIESVIDRDALILPEKSSKLYHSDNSLRFKNGSVIYFVGSQDAKDKVGGNLDLLIISEMALIRNTEILTYLIPSTLNVNGDIVLVSTPRFASYFNEILEDTSNNIWHRSILKATDKEAVDNEGVPIWTNEKLEKARQMMSDSKYKQEYECATDVANEESIYNESLKKAKWINEITTKDKKLYVSADLGINDATALTFIIDDVVVHNYANTDKATMHYIEYIKAWAKQKDIRRVHIILPHDANNRQDAIGHLTSRKRAYSEHFNDVSVLGAYAVNKTIEITRHSIEQGKIKFLNCENVRAMVKLMKSYEWKIDKVSGENLRVPVHGRGLSASNTCDSLEYFCMYRFLDEYNENINEFIAFDYRESLEGWTY